MAVTVTTEGPLFDGRGQRALTEITDDIARTVGAAGHDMVLSGLDATLRNPTGAYRDTVVLNADGPRSSVHDQMNIYGAWLEGVGSRNAPVTKFEGYHNFRNATDLLNHQMAQQIAEDVVRRHLHKLGG